MNCFKTSCLLVGFLLIIAVEGARDSSSFDRDSAKHKSVRKYNNNGENNGYNNYQEKQYDIPKKKPKRNKKIKNKFLSKVRVVRFEQCELTVKKCYEDAMKDEPREGRARDILLLECADQHLCPPIRIRICIRKDILNIKKVKQRCRKWNM